MLRSIPWWGGIALSITLCLLVSEMVTGKAQAQFERQVEAANFAMHTRLRSYVDVLHSTQALLQSPDPVNEKEFHGFVSRLSLEQDFPGIQQLSFAASVSTAEFDSFIAALKSGAALPQPQSDTAAQTRAHLLAYAYPDMRVAPGTDLATEPAIAAALMQARDEGRLVVTALGTATAPHLVSAEAAFLMPVYRGGAPLSDINERRTAYRGVVAATLDLDALARNVVDARSLQHVQLQISTNRKADAGFHAQAEDAHILFANVAHAANKSDPYFSKTVSTSVGPYLWQTSYSAPRSTLIVGSDAYLPWLVLLVGMAGSTLLFAVFHSLIRAREHANERARSVSRELRASQTQLAQVQQMVRLGSWLLEPDGEEMTWSAETGRILGVDMEATTPSMSALLACIAEEDRENFRKGIQNALKQNEGFQMEHRVCTRDGSLRWVQTVARKSRSGKPVLLGVMRDITEPRHTMEALRRSQELLRELTAYQDRVKEDERKRIAREIHDELGQTLLALRIDVQMLEARTSDRHPRLNEKVRSALNQIDATVKTIRSIINNLRPSVLDLGLTAAIEWQVTQFRRRSGIACELINDAEDLVVDDTRATSLFRILQESLTNVIRHANATKVTIELSQKDEQVVMRISDNGVGIYPGDRRKNSFGLVGVEERVHALHGKFFLQSQPGGGTTLIVHIPLESAPSINELSPDERA